MLNSVAIMGRLTATPEIKTTTKGVNVTTFTVVVDRTYGEQTDFINVVAWRSTADFVTTYFQKDSMIAVIGSIQTRNYEDKNGNKRKAVEIVASNVSFCGSKSNSKIQTNSNAMPECITEQEVEKFESLDIDDDELPF